MVIVKAADGTHCHQASCLREGLVDVNLELGEYHGVRRFVLNDAGRVINLELLLA